MLDNEIIFQYITPLLPIPTPLTKKGKPAKKIQCILFDIYGTLFVSKAGDISSAGNDPIKTSEIKKLLDDFGIEKTPDEILMVFFSSIKEEHAKLKQAGIDYPEVKIERIWQDIIKTDDLNTAKRFAVLFELIVNPVYPMPNLKRMLSACKKSGIKMGIVSNAQFYTEYLFHWFLGVNPQGAGFCSKLIFYSYIYGRAKPSIYMFDLAVEKLNDMGIFPESVLYIGNDMLNDVLPARKAGFQTALFAGDKRSLRLRNDHPECKNFSADMIITDLIQITDES